MHLKKNHNTDSERPAVLAIYTSEDKRSNCGPDDCNPYCNPNCNPFEDCNPKCVPPFVSRESD